MLNYFDKFIYLLVTLTFCLSIINRLQYEDLRRKDILKTGKFIYSPQQIMKINVLHN